MGEQHERKAGPSLPPSPLTPMREAVPLSRFSLPWRTVLFALLAGPVAAAVVGLAFAALHQHALPVAFGVSIVMAWRGLLLGIGAALGDRVASSWPRTARWSLGMGVSGLVPGLELLAYAMVFRPLPYAVPWTVASVLRDALAGALFAWAAESGRGGQWKACLAGAAAWLAYLACDAALLGPVTYDRYSPGGHLQPAQIASSMILAACLLGLVLARALRTAWQKSAAGGAGLRAGEGDEPD